MCDDVFSANRLLAWDYRLGLTGSGLILYGALPASLAALGIFKTPDQSKLFSLGLHGLFLLVLVAAIPVVLMFILVRQRLSNWYLLRDFLWLRASLITLAILSVSTAVCLATGLLLGTYKVVSPADWWTLPIEEKSGPLLHSLLLAIAYLVGSTTLFLTVLKEEGSLPLLPKKAEVENIEALRTSLRRILNDELWSKMPTRDDIDILNVKTSELEIGADQAKQLLKSLSNSFGRLGRTTLYSEISNGLDALQSATNDVRGSYVKWSSYWGPEFGNLSEEQKDRRSKLKKLKGLKIYG